MFTQCCKRLWCISWPRRRRAIRLQKKRSPQNNLKLLSKLPLKLMALMTHLHQKRKEASKNPSKDAKLHLPTLNLRFPIPSSHRVLEFSFRASPNLFLACPSPLPQINPKPLTSQLKIPDSPAKCYFLQAQSLIFNLANQKCRKALNLAESQINRSSKSTSQEIHLQIFLARKELRLFGKQHLIRQRNWRALQKSNSLLKCKVFL